MNMDEMSDVVGFRILYLLFERRINIEKWGEGETEKRSLPFLNAADALTNVFCFIGPR